MPSRLEKGGKGGKSASRVGKNLKMLIESTRLFGTQEYVPATIQLVLSSVRSYKRITHPQNNVIHSEKESMLSYLLVF